jgi:transposase
MDESGFSLNFPVTKCWMKRHEQKRLPAATQVRQSGVVAGVIDWQTAEVWCSPLENLSSTALIHFFSWLFLEVFPHEKLVIVMDNASAHHAHSMQAFFSLFEHRVRVLWLPPYSPDLNLIERFWKHLKLRITANRLFASLEEMFSALQAELIRQNASDYEFRFSFSKF